MTINLIFYRGYQIYFRNREYFLIVRSVGATTKGADIYSSKTLFKIHKLIDELIEYQFIGDEFDTMRLKKLDVNNSLNWIKQL